MRVAFGLLWWTACVPAPGPEVVREQPGTDPGEPEPEPPVVEVCNGLDDDRDGDIDEGFPDIDQDGIADCQDRDCELEITVPHVDWLATCDRPLEPPTVGPGDPWDIGLQWTWGRRAARGVLHPPLVGRFLPDAGPQVIVLDDLGVLVVVDGATGRELAAFSGFDTSTTPALGDLDHDGRPEVVLVDGARRVVALRSDGTRLWEAGPFRGTLDGWVSIALADLDIDGTPEVIADRLILDGTTGAWRATLDVQVGVRAPLIVDLDLDGRPEILLGETAFSGDGTVRWRTPIDSRPGAVFTAVAQLDADPHPELIVTFRERVSRVEHDGTLTATYLAKDDVAGPPCAGPSGPDADGPGTLVAVPAGLDLVVLEPDLTVRWRAQVGDPSGSAGCAWADLDANGVPEIVHADHDTVRIFQSARGQVRWARPHASVTMWEYPVIADLDADGSAEIVLATSQLQGGTLETGLTVYHHLTDSWAAGNGAWTGQESGPDVVNPDLSVRVRPPVSWRDPGVWRGAWPANRVMLPAPGAALVDACVASCEPGGRVRVAAALTNAGEAPYRAAVQAARDGVPLGAPSEVVRVREGLASTVQILELTADDVREPWSLQPVGAPPGCQPAAAAPMPALCPP